MCYGYSYVGNVHILKSNWCGTDIERDQVCNVTHQLAGVRESESLSLSRKAVGKYSHFLPCCTDGVRSRERVPRVSGVAQARCYRLHIKADRDFDRTHVIVLLPAARIYSMHYAVEVNSKSALTSKINKTSNNVNW